MNLNRTLENRLATILPLQVSLSHRMHRMGEGSRVRASERGLSIQTISPDFLFPPRYLAWPD